MSHKSSMWMVVFVSSMACLAAQDLHILFIAPSNRVDVQLLRNGTENVQELMLLEGESFLVTALFTNLSTNGAVVAIEIDRYNGIEHASAMPNKFQWFDSHSESFKGPSYETLPTFGDTMDEHFSVVLSNSSPLVNSGNIGELAKAKNDTTSAIFNFIGKFLGLTKLRFIVQAAGGEKVQLSRDINVKVKRGNPLMDKVFTYVVIAMVTFTYINMGCAIDINEMKLVLKNPVSPIIGMVCQYLFMPVISYVVGYVLFWDEPALWLGMFLTGCSPGGGGSNMWTYLLGGSLDLSVAMTFISTVAAFVCLPVWIYSLAHTIFQDAEFSQLPFGTIAAMVVGLVLPCAGGVLIRYVWPHVADILKKYLAVTAVIFVLFMVTFGIYVNIHIFRFLTWKVLFAGMLLPWLGFSFGWLMALACRRSWAEVTAISIETGIQNAGLAVGVLKVALSAFDPLADMALVVPIAVSMLTPVPLVMWLVTKKLLQCHRERKGIHELDGKEGVEAKPSVKNINITPASSTTRLTGT